ncbi:hypothetical protein GCM10027569_83840 [Flindersiella endophytica]
MRTVARTHSAILRCGPGPQLGATVTVSRGRLPEPDPVQTGGLAQAANHVHFSVEFSKGGVAVAYKESGWAMEPYVHCTGTTWCLT